MQSRSKSSGLLICFTYRARISRITHSLTPFVKRLSWFWPAVCPASVLPDTLCVGKIDWLSHSRGTTCSTTLISPLCETTVLILRGCCRRQRSKFSSIYHDWHLWDFPSCITWNWFSNKWFSTVPVRGLSWQWHWKIKLMSPECIVCRSQVSGETRGGRESSSVCRCEEWAAVVQILTHSAAEWVTETSNSSLRSGNLGVSPCFTDLLRAPSGQ